MQIVAVVVAAIMIPVSRLVRRAPALESGPFAPSGDPANPEMSLAQALRSPQFIILPLTNFFCCATHSGPTCAGEARRSLGVAGCRGRPPGFRLTHA
jgi:hypothetical protein